MKRTSLPLRRREFIAGVGSAAAWPLAARAQQALPVVGVLIGGTAQPDGTGFVQANMAALRKGLSETGFVEGNNVEILHLGAEWQYDRLRALATELVRRRVAVIFALWNVPALVAKSATETLPVVFAVGGDPVQLGLVARIDRPDANVTGVFSFSAASIQKRLQLLHEILPAARTVGFLINPTSRQKDFDLREVETAARILDISVVTLSATTPAEIETALAPIKGQGIDALLIANDAMFFDPAAIARLVALAASHAVPTIYDSRIFVDAGGLMSYGANYDDLLRLAGTYVGRILKGEKPANLPVQQATRVETVLNSRPPKRSALRCPNRSCCAPTR
jgi:putative tryptophan/tyrosine transport system substrate-binding protein